MTAPTGSTPIAAVITFYRDDRFFPEALASALAQTRRPDDIVVVDDASPPDQARTLAALDPRIRVVRHERNRGAGAARQSGSAATDAPFIAYLDADDSWLPGKLAAQAALLESDPSIDAVHCALISVRPHGERVFSEKPALLDLETQLYQNRVLPSSLMIRREALDAVGGWSPDRRLMEDWDLSTRLVAAGRRVVFLPEPLVRFRRMNHGNLSSRGLRHMAILLQTVWHHRALYRATGGRRFLLRTMRGVLAREGYRRGGVSGRMLRLLALWRQA